MVLPSSYLVTGRIMEFQSPESLMAAGLHKLEEDIVIESFILLCGVVPCQLCTYSNTSASTPYCVPSTYLTQREGRQSRLSTNGAGVDTACCTTNESTAPNDL